MAYPKTLTVIYPDGTIETREPAGPKWTLDELRAVIGGGYIERVKLGGRSIALVDEDGHPLQQEHNPVASERAGIPLVGIVAFGDASVLS